jgi:ferric-dicitrate binding protein FerR (iron transport regulator)
MDDVMRTLARAGYVALACFFLPAGNAVAQLANVGCTSAPSANASQTLHCDNGITIVTENGAKFELKDRNRDGHVDSAELSGKALLVEVPKKPGGNRFEVLTPQAIAAVRGTKWAVDAADGKTSVLVVDGRVSVGRPGGGRRVVLGPGEGVDVEATGPLMVKRWAPARVTALLARLGQ